MKGMLIPTNGNPVEIDIEVDETGSTLHNLQRLVGGNIEPFDVIFGEAISLVTGSRFPVATFQNAVWMFSICLASKACWMSISLADSSSMEVSWPGRQ